jgi:hypothetical protein
LRHRTLSRSITRDHQTVPAILQIAWSCAGPFTVIIGAGALIAVGAARERSERFLLAAAFVVPCYQILIARTGWALDKHLAPGMWCAVLAAGIGFAEVNGNDVFVIANHFDAKLGDQNADSRYQYPAQSSAVQRSGQALAEHRFVSQILAIDKRRGSGLEVASDHLGVTGPPYGVSLAFTAIVQAVRHADTPNLSSADGRLHRIGDHRLGVAVPGSGQRRSAVPARLWGSRARGGAHDGEPVVRPFPQLAAWG